MPIKKEGSNRVVATEGRVTQILFETRQIPLDGVNRGSRMLQTHEFIRATVAESKPIDLPLFDKLEAAAIYDYDVGQPVDRQFAISTMLDCASYYENIGFPEKALKLAKRGLEWADINNNIPLKRRAHNCVGVTYLRSSDFNNACLNMKKAYDLARQLDDKQAVFSALANIVAILECMGLLADARDLALQAASSQPWGDEKLDSLHLSNASNGLRMSHVLNDKVSARTFFRFANKASTSLSSFTSEITKAHFEAARIIHLVAEGNFACAGQFADVALNKDSARTNIRVRALIVCAQADLHLALGTAIKIKFSRDAALMLLAATKSLPDHHEEILRTLVKLHAVTDVVFDESVSSHYVRLLRDHTLTVKHREFFKNALNSSQFKTSRTISLENPYYVIPGWICNLETESSAEHMDLYGRELQAGPERKNIPFDVAEFQKCTIHDPISTEEFSIAENWAVVADFAAGGNGRHYFHVGKVASAIAKQLGHSEDEARRLECACRLHDIGELAISCWPRASSKIQAFGTFSLLCEHTSFGEFLLSSSGDVTLQLASRIAKSHHEWWNGCGYPLGLRAECIPIEGRICSISDTFVIMLGRNAGKSQWSIDVAIKQIQAMSGMQLDPSLVLALTNVFSENNTFKGKTYRDGQMCLRENQLTGSEQYVSEILDFLD